MPARTRSVIRFGWVGEKPEGVSIRAWREALKAGWFAVGEYYDQVVQPRKFEPGAADRYGYQPRKERYLKSKRRRAERSWRVKDGGLLNNVYSGITRTAVKRRQIPRPFYNRVVVETPTPRYVAMRPYKSGRPNIGAELSSLAADERREMERIFQETVEQRLSQYKGGRKK
jgi:hypothetical protein